MMRKRLRNSMSHIHQQTCIHLHNLMIRMKKSHILLPIRRREKSRILDAGSHLRIATSCYHNQTCGRHHNWTHIHHFLHKEIRDKPEFGTHLIHID